MKTRISGLALVALLSAGTIFAAGKVSAMKKKFEGPASEQPAAPAQQPVVQVAQMAPAEQKGEADNDAKIREVWSKTEKLLQANNNNEGFYAANGENEEVIQLLREMKSLLSNRGYQTFVVFLVEWQKAATQDTFDRAHPYRGMILYHMKRGSFLLYNRPFKDKKEYSEALALLTPTYMEGGRQLMNPLPSRVGDHGYIYPGASDALYANFQRLFDERSKGLIAKQKAEQQPPAYGAE